MTSEEIEGNRAKTPVLMRSLLGWGARNDVNRPVQIDWTGADRQR
jgi:hypothetical protein